METYQAETLKKRSKQFAIRVVKLFQALPKTDEATVLGKQVLRSGTSLAANNRAVCRARSRGEFLAKIGVVVKEADETSFGWSYWLTPGSSSRREGKGRWQRPMSFWRFSPLRSAP